MIYDPDGHDMAKDITAKRHVERATALTPLQAEARTAIPTPEAAAHLGRSPQTLRLWACTESGPLRPLRVNGRLLWPVAELRKLLGVNE